MSNEYERFLSQVKLVYSDLRKSMDPDTLEVRMFLSFNKDRWVATSVQTIRYNMRREPQA
jgi:hypothetical protein